MSVNEQGPNPSYSVILPFYGQSEHMNAIVADIQTALDAYDPSYELIVIINGVTEQANESVETRDGRTVRCTLKNSGWGLAVLHGMQKARGTYICYTNSARTESRELIKLLTYARVSADAIVKATRIERSTFTRKWVSIVYNLLNRIILGTPIWDVNATPKVVPKKILDTIPLSSTGDSIDAEFMYKASRKNIPIIEIPIKQIERKGGRSTTNWMSAFWMFVGLLRIRTNA